MQNEKPWSAVAVKLLKGPLYKKREKKEIWDNLLTYKGALDEYFGVLGLRVFLETIDGYAYLEEISQGIEKGMEDEDKDENEDVSSTRIPHIIKKTPLSYSASMLLVLLRNEIEKFELSQSQSDYAIMRKSEIAGLYKSFTKDKADEVKQMRSLDTTLRLLSRLTYIFPRGDALSDNDISDDAEFELSPIIKARIDIEFMKELLKKMKEKEKRSEGDLLGDEEDER